MNSWRPDDWGKCPCDDCSNKVIDTYGWLCDLACGKWSAWKNYEAGADAMLEALQEKFCIFPVENDDDMKTKIAKSNAVGMGLIEKANDE